MLVLVDNQGLKGNDQARQVTPKTHCATAVSLITHEDSLSYLQSQGNPFHPGPEITPPHPLASPVDRLALIGLFVPLRWLLRSMLTIPLADGTNPTAVTQAIKGALQSDKAIDGIFTLGSAIALDALKAVDQVGRTGKVTIGTTDLSNADLEAVQQGKLMFVIDQQPYLQGFDSVEIAVQYIRYGVHPIGPVITGPLLITNANVAEVVEKNKAHRGIRRAM